MLDSLNENKAAKAINIAVEKVLDEGFRSSDLWKDGYKLSSTQELGDLVSSTILN